MKKQKEFLRSKIIEFQLQIADLSRTLRQQEDMFQVREKDLYSDLFEILDAFENLEETIEAKKEDFNKSAKSLARNIRAIHKKTLRMIKARNIVPMEFPDDRAQIDYCKIVATQESVGLENGTILSVVKTGYIDERNNKIYRKAEVITVLNE